MNIINSGIEGDLGNMKHHVIDGTKFQSLDYVLSTMQSLLHVIEENPRILVPVKDMDEESSDILAAEGFRLYPTVKNTTLIYDDKNKCFIKVLHPLSLKKNISFLLNNRARNIYHVAGYLSSRGIKMPRIVAYGTMRIKRLPFFVMEKVEGRSLYELTVKKGETMKSDIYLKIIGQVAKLHGSGYWLGDAHPAHVFIQGREVSGFIDIDSIRRNRPFRINNFAKDIAGLNHPQLPFPDELKKQLLLYYCELIDVQKRDSFKFLVKQYSERRWHAS